MVEAPARFLDGVAIGDSIACSGVCLTVVALKGRRFAADASVETLSATTARAWRAGTALNLERALTLGQPLGGHLVSGHVDGVGRLASRRADGRSERLRFSLPRALARYVARKGSICVDGVSLTVNEAGAGGFGVNIVPHTLRHTTLGRLAPGDAVNLEVDLVARYLEKLARK
jgi:riboflavin synthase